MTYFSWVSWKISLLSHTHKKFHLVKENTAIIFCHESELNVFSNLCEWLSWYSQNEAPLATSDPSSFCSCPQLSVISQPSVSHQTYKTHSTTLTDGDESQIHSNQPTSVSQNEHRKMLLSLIGLNHQMWFLPAPSVGLTMYLSIVGCLSRDKGLSLWTIYLGTTMCSDVTLSEGAQPHYYK